MYCTPTDVVAFFPHLALDLPDQPELSTAAVIRAINRAATRVQSAAQRLGLALPASMPDPVTSAWLICETLTAELAAGEILSQRALVGAIDPVLQRQALVATAAAERRLDLLATGKLSAAWAEALPVYTLAAVADVERYVPGFVANATHPPTIATVTRWIQRQSSIVAAIARLLGYPVTGLTSQQQIAYADLVGQQVASWTLRAHTLTQYGQIIDPQVNHLTTTAADDLDDFAEADLYGWVS